MEFDAIVQALSTIGIPAGIACFALFVMQKTQTEIVVTLAKITETLEGIKEQIGGIEK